jgi:alpha-mannosidase
LALSPDFLVLSALTVSKDGKRLVVRFYNPLREAVQATVSFGVAVREVCRVDAAENIMRQLEPAENPLAYELQVGPAEIVTLLVMP